MEKCFTSMSRLGGVHIILTLFLQSSIPEEHSLGSTPQLHITQEHKAVTAAARKSFTPSPRQKRLSSPSISLTTVAGGNVSPKLSPSPGYSPTIIPRRYKLAAATCRDAGTQTDVCTPVVTDGDDRQSKSDQLDIRKTADGSDNGKRIGQSDEGKRTDQSDTLPPNIVDALDSAKADVLRIQEEKKVGWRYFQICCTFTLLAQYYDFVPISLSSL